VLITSYTSAQLLGKTGEKAVILLDEAQDSYRDGLLWIDFFQVPGIGDWIPSRKDIWARIKGFTK
jgi:hypothetical protein